MINRGFWLAAVLSVSWLTIARHAVPAADRPPNILLVVSDDQGYSDLGSLGVKPVKTPHLDRLAAEGVRGTSFYVAWPACTPSRGSILTGRYPQRHGLYDMIRNDMTDYGHRYTPEEYAVSPEMVLGLDVREITLGDILRQGGYACGMVGKWDMGQARRFLPLQRGFDFFYGIGNNGVDYYTHERYGIHSMFRGNARTKADQGTYATDLFRREALRFINDHRHRPWFLYLCFTAPHSASNFEKEGVQAPEEYVAPYRDRVANLKLARYYAALTSMDDALGQVLLALEQSGSSHDTLVLFCSDNGGSGNGGNAPLRGGKGGLWEGGLRVPFIARWPGRIPPGTVTDEFLTTLEFFPTIAAVAGVRTNGIILDGFNMLPVLQGKAKSTRLEMFWERRADHAARVRHWKWVRSGTGGGLFDLSRDPEEARDLSKSHPEALALVKQHFSAWRTQMADAEPRGPFRDH